MAFRESKICFSCQSSNGPFVLLQCECLILVCEGCATEKLHSNDTTCPSCKADAIHTRNIHEGDGIRCIRNLAVSADTKLSSTICFICRDPFTALDANTDDRAAMISALFPHECIDQCCQICVREIFSNRSESFYDGYVCSLCKTTLPIYNIRESSMYETELINSCFEHFDIMSNDIRAFDGDSIKFEKLLMKALNKLWNNDITAPGVYPQSWMEKETLSIAQKRLLVARLELKRQRVESTGVNDTSYFPLGPLKKIKIPRHITFEATLPASSSNMERDEPSAMIRNPCYPFGAAHVTEDEDEDFFRPLPQEYAHRIECIHIPGCGFLCPYCHPKKLAVIEHKRQFIKHLKEDHKGILLKENIRAAFHLHQCLECTAYVKVSSVYRHLSRCSECLTRHQDNIKQIVNVHYKNCPVRHDEIGPYNHFDEPKRSFRLLSDFALLSSAGELISFLSPEKGGRVTGSLVPVGLQGNWVTVDFYFNAWIIFYSDDGEEAIFSGVLLIVESTQHTTFYKLATPRDDYAAFARPVFALRDAFFVLYRAANIYLTSASECNGSIEDLLSLDPSLSDLMPAIMPFLAVVYTFLYRQFEHSCKLMKSVTEKFKQRIIEMEKSGGAFSADMEEAAFASYSLLPPGGISTANSLNVSNHLRPLVAGGAADVAAPTQHADEEPVADMRIGGIAVMIRPGASSTVPKAPITLSPVKRFPQDFISKANRERNWNVFFEVPRDLEEQDAFISRHAERLGNMVQYRLHVYLSNPDRFDEERMMRIPRIKKNLEATRSTIKDQFGLNIQSKCLTFKSTTNHNLQGRNFAYYNLLPFSVISLRPTRYGPPPIVFHPLPSSNPVPQSSDFTSELGGSGLGRSDNLKPTGQSEQTAASSESSTAARIARAMAQQEARARNRQAYFTAFNNTEFAAERRRLWGSRGRGCGEHDAAPVVKQWSSNWDEGKKAAAARGIIGSIDKLGKKKKPRPLHGRKSEIVDESEPSSSENEEFLSRIGPSVPREALADFYRSQNDLSSNSDSDSESANSVDEADAIEIDRARPHFFLARHSVAATLLSSDVNVEEAVTVTSIATNSVDLSPRAPPLASSAAAMETMSSEMKAAPSNEKKRPLEADDSSLEADGKSGGETKNDEVGIFVDDRDGENVVLWTIDRRAGGDERETKG